jgi:O-antigen/teichoic acid export membrane protein
MSEAGQKITPPEAADGPPATLIPAGILADPNERHFRTDHLQVDLKGQSVRGAAMALSAQATRFLLHLGSTMVLARLLAPSDFGLIAMVTAVTGLLAMFKDAGLSMATIQRQELVHRQVSMLFWINAGLSIGITLVVAALAPALAWFYGEPRLVEITLVLAGTFIFGGLSVQHQALLRRQMRFKELAIVEVLSMATGIAVGIGMAAARCGYWSLVGLHAGTAVAHCVLVWRFSGWRPGRPSRGSGIGPMLGFGGSLTVASFCNHLREQFPLIAIGQALGSAPLAIYERAYRLLVLPLSQMMPPLSAVAVPVLCRLQDHPERFRRTARRLILLASASAVPCSVAGVLAAPELVEIALGSQWRRAAVLFALLSPLAATQTVSAIGIWLLTTTGQGAVLLRFTVINALLAVASIWIGLQFGLEAAALSFSGVGLLVRTPILYAFIARYTPVGWSDLARACGAFVAAGLFLGVAGGVLRYLVLGIDGPSVLWAASSFAVVAAVWLPLAWKGGVLATVSDLRRS